MSGYLKKRIQLLSAYLKNNPLSDSVDLKMHPNAYTYIQICNSVIELPKSKIICTYCCHIHIHVVHNVKKTKQHSSPKLVSGRPYTQSNVVYVKLELGRVETELLNVVYGE